MRGATESVSHCLYVLCIEWGAKRIAKFKEMRENGWFVHLRDIHVD